MTIMHPETISLADLDVVTGGRPDPEPATIQPARPSSIVEWFDNRLDDAKKIITDLGKKVGEKLHDGSAANDPSRIPGRNGPR